MRAAEESDRVLPIMPIDQAIIESVRKGSRGEDRKMRDFFGGIMIVGGGAKMPGFNTFLEYKLRNHMPGFTKEILVGVPPREMDQQLVAWKGGSVFGRLSSSGNDSWIYQKEYDLLGAKLLYQKLMFPF
jgi:actin-related protein 8